MGTTTLLMALVLAPGADAPLPAPVFLDGGGRGASAAPASGGVVIVGEPERVVAVGRGRNDSLIVRTSGGSYETDPVALVTAQGRLWDPLEASRLPLAGATCVMTSTNGRITAVSFTGGDPAPRPVAVVTATGARAPIGHTHTCANGHTWDHSANPGHNCPVCGLAQYVQDPVPRTVNVGVSARTTAGPAYTYSSGCGPEGCSIGGYSTQYGSAPFTYGIGSGYGVGAGSGGCANGSCNIQSSGRSGWYLGKNLGR